MQLALNLGVANFVSALELCEKFDLICMGKAYPYEIRLNKGIVDPETWLKITYLAIILRDADALGIMCRIPTDVLREGDSISPESTYYLVKFMKGLFDRTADIGELLITAMKSTEDTDYMFDIRVPLLGLYGSYFSDDQNEFNESLDEALRFHKTFWTDNPDNTHDYNGWISVELLAALSIACDNKDWVQEIESDYVPYWLANGELV